MNKNFIAQGVGERIQQVLNSMSMTQTQLCKDIGISKTAMSNYINENRTPDTITCLKLSKALGVTMEWLLTGIGEFNKDTQCSMVESSTPNHSIELESNTLSQEERLLLENFRDLTEREQDEILGKAARLAVKADVKRYSTSRNTKNDEEISDSLDIG